MIKCERAALCCDAVQNHKETVNELAQKLSRPGYVVAAAGAVEESFQSWIKSVVGLHDKGCNDCRAVKLAQAMAVRVEC